MSAAASPRVLGSRHVSVVAALAFGLDVISNVLGSVLLEGRSISLGPVTFRLVRNSGIALGFGSGAPAWLAIAITIGVTVVVIVMTMRECLEARPRGWWSEEQSATFWTARWTERLST